MHPENYNGGKLFNSSQVSYAPIQKQGESSQLKGSNFYFPPSYESNTHAAYQSKHLLQY